MDETKRVDVSVLVPVRNESGNVGPLLREIGTALEGREAFEVIYIDDGSTDDTGRELVRLSGVHPWLRVVTHDQSCGQSCAVRSGARVARGSILVTMDGDGQNDPAYLPAMIEALALGGRDGGPRRRPAARTQGHRLQALAVAHRQSRAPRVLKDGTRDTGCGLKAIRREVYLALPYFDALHRFMPALVKREGYAIAYVDVVDRPRLTGRSNYGFFDRLWVGILDLYGVWWLMRRRRRVPAIRESVSDAR